MQKSAFDAVAASNNIKKYIDSKMLYCTFDLDQIFQILRVAKLTIEQATAIMQQSQDKYGPADAFNIFRHCNVELGTDSNKILDYFETLYKVLKARPFRHMFNYISDLADKSNLMVESAIEKCEFNLLKSQQTSAKSSPNKKINNESKSPKGKNSGNSIESNNELQELKKSCSNKDEAIRNLQEELRQRENAISENKKLIIELQNSITEANTELNLKTSRLTKVEKAIKYLDVELKKKEAQIKFLQEQSGAAMNRLQGDDTNLLELQQYQPINDDHETFESVFNIIDRSCSNNDSSAITYAIVNGFCDIAFGQNTILSFAAQNSKPYMIEKLNNSGYTIFEKESALSSIVFGFCVSDCIDGIKFIFQHVDVNRRYPSFRNNTLLNIAAKIDAINIVKYLCSIKGIEVTAKDDDGDTSIHWAAEGDALNVMKYLAQLPNIDLNMKDKFGETPLHRACISCSLNVVKYLCSQVQVRVNEKDKKGNTPLHLACQSGEECYEIVKHLCSVKRVLRNEKNLDGKTPSSLSSIDNVKKLLSPKPIKR